MYDLIIFDLDGVLIDSKEVHFNALNNALSEVGKEYIISKEDHLKIYDGLPTRKKLSLLAELKGFQLKNLTMFGKESKRLQLSF